MQQYPLWGRAIIAGIGAAAAIAVLGWLQQWHYSWLIAPFGATAVLLFAVPDSPLASAKNVIGGHFLSALVALLMLNCFGQEGWVVAVAVGMAIALMVWLHLTHPPAGATALLIMLTAPDWWFLFSPVLVGAVLMVSVAWCYHHSHQFSLGWVIKRRVKEPTVAE